MATCAPSAPAGAALSSSSIWLSCATAATGGDLDVSLWTIGKKSTPRLRVPSSTTRVPRSSSPQDRRLSVRATPLKHVAKPRLGGGAGTRLGGRGEGRQFFGASGPASGGGWDCWAGWLQGRSPPGGGRSGSTSQGGGASEKFFAGGAGRVGSDSAAARRRGTRAGKFSKPRKPASRSSLGR